MEGSIAHSVRFHLGRDRETVKNRCAGGTKTERERIAREGPRGKRCSKR